jgi:tetratricopeptide (TPR) repeat protein
MGEFNCGIRDGLLFVVSVILLLPCNGQAVSQEAAPEPPRYDDNSEADMILLLNDLAADVRRRLAHGEDVSEQLQMMDGLVRKGEIVARNFVEIMEDLLPEVPDEDLVAEHTIDVASAYQWIREFDEADRVLEGLIARYPDPSTEWGRSSRYVQATHEIGRKDHESARDHLEELWAVADSYDEKVFRRIGMQLTNVHHVLGDWDSVLRVGLPAIPAEIGTLDHSANIYTNIANAYLETGDFENAQIYFQDVVDFLNELEAEDPDNWLLDLPLKKYAARKLGHAQVGLRTAEYERQGDVNRLNSAIESAFLHTAVEDAVTGMVENMDETGEDVASDGDAESAKPVPAPEEQSASGGASKLPWLLAGGMVVLVGLALYFKRA